MSTSNYYKKMFKIPIFTKEEERRLLLAYRHDGDEKAKDKLVTGFMKLVISMASQYKRRAKSPVDLDDLVSEGVIGLSVALDKFDVERVADDGSPIRFATCARLWISAYMMTAIMNCFSSVHKVSANWAFKTVFFNLGKKMSARGYVFPLSEEEMSTLATDMKVGLDDVKMMISLKMGELRLDATTPDGSGTYMDMLADPTITCEDDLLAVIEGKELWPIFDDACAILTDRETKILATRTYADEPAKLEALAVEFGVTKERIRQIEKNANETVIDVMRRKVKKQC